MTDESKNYLLARISSLEKENEKLRGIIKNNGITKEDVDAIINEKITRDGY